MAGSKLRAVRWPSFVFFLSKPSLVLTFFATYPEFLEMWSALRWPAIIDIEKSLQILGQTPAQISNSAIAPTTKKEKGKKKANRMRHAKIQNTHLDIDLTKDYVPPTQEPGKL